ncbi:hypothetical protein B0T25DRAFT_570234 [Lasiosphaeria hispida]|uniref:Uncharacterized protein n=1 Tax=Lasiosphaeria hispida TaxID=260671 RepID=A0AAJ0MCK8_9PEZI|nr:hypothetical protein B0T25DRAFT_570234 [Lasiosphaeria hispida]
MAVRFLLSSSSSQKSFSSVDLRGVKDNAKAGILDESIPITGRSAICRGATLWGISHSEKKLEVRSRLARCSYGVRIEIPMENDGVKHDPDSNDSDCGGPKYRMGERIVDGRRIVTKLEINERIDVGWSHLLIPAKQWFSHSLQYCQEEKPPAFFNEYTVYELCTVSHRIRKGSLFRHGKARNGKYRGVEFTFAVEMGSASLDFFVVYNDGE